MALEDKVSDEFGAGKIISGTATAAILKGVGAFDNRVAYGFFDMLTTYLPVSPYLLGDPITQVLSFAAGIATAGAKPGKQRTGGFALLGAAGLYSLYSYVQDVGIPGSYLATGTFGFTALQSVILPVLALYAMGYIGRSIYNTISHYFRKRRRSQGWYDDKKRVGYKRTKK